MTVTEVCLPGRRRNKLISDYTRLDAGALSHNVEHAAARQDEARAVQSPGAAETERALVVERLTKRFGERSAFADVSFTVDHGEVFGFLGPNGAGKTTMVRTLGTLLTPSSGFAAVAGLALSPEQRSRDPPAHRDHA